MRNEERRKVRPQGQLTIRSYSLSYALSRNRASSNKNVTNSGAKSFWVNTVWWRQVTPYTRSTGSCVKLTDSLSHAELASGGETMERDDIAHTQRRDEIKSTPARVSKEGRESGRTKHREKREDHKKTDKDRKK